MTKRELLENYRVIVMEIETLERQSTFLNQFIGGPKPVHAVRLTGMPRGTNDPEAAVLQRQDYDDAISKIEKRCEELRGLVSAFENIIESIPNIEDAMIIRDYYALGWTDIKIGMKMGYDKSTIWKRRTKVMNTLSCQIVD